MYLFNNPLTTPTAPMPSSYLLSILLVCLGLLLQSAASSSATCKPTYHSIGIYWPADSGSRYSLSFPSHLPSLSPLISPLFQCFFISTLLSPLSFSPLMFLYLPLSPHCASFLIIVPHTPPFPSLLSFHYYLPHPSLTSLLANSMIFLISY